YSQAGTPVVNVRGIYDSEQQAFTLEFEQSCPPTPGQPDKLPFLIPVATALLDHAGNELPLTLAEGDDRVSAGNVLAVTDRRASFRFAGVPSRPVPSLLRGFSAPVILNYDYTDADLAHLMAHDSDPFNRWEAGQRLAMRVILAGITAHQRGTAPEFPLGFFHAVERILADAEADPAFAAEALSLPNAGYIAEQMEVVDAD
ncbi:MAG: DUF3458 domain-containing protein, partial [Halieaceae bacterium]|nr:DUF3458 domain-containing protein [Halieaceae bacterium]